jgi:hypothetical protein
VVDLMDVLDAPDRQGQGSGDFDFLTRMRTPGALELLSSYERLSPETRASLVHLIRTLAAEADAASAPAAA